MAEKDVHVDFTKAAVLEPMPAPGPYLFVISAFEWGTSAAGAKKVHCEYTVVDPEKYAKRKVFDDISVENEYTLGRLMSLLIASGEKKEDLEKPTYKVPATDKMLGRQFTGFVTIRESEDYGDRNQMRRVRPASAYEAGPETEF